MPIFSSMVMFPRSYFLKPSIRSRVLAFHGSVYTQHGKKFILFYTEKEGLFFIDSQLCLGLAMTAVVSVLEIMLLKKGIILSREDLLYI